MVTITSHIFINIFQMVHFSAVKFDRGNEKNMSFLLIPKSPKVWEKSEAIGPGTFNIISSLSENIILRHTTVCLKEKPQLFLLTIIIELCSRINLYML